MWGIFIQAISQLKNIDFRLKLKTKNRIFSDEKRITPKLDKNKTCFGWNKIADTSSVFKI